MRSRIEITDEALVSANYKILALCHWEGAELLENGGGLTRYYEAWRNIHVYEFCGPDHLVRNYTVALMNVVNHIQPRED